VVAGLGDGDAVQRQVELPVASAAEPALLRLMSQRHADWR
jgi:hypothetical protein